MSAVKNNEVSTTEITDSQPAWLDLVRDQVASLKFGTVLITVHDSRVVQVDRNERVRLASPVS